jgi:predicted NAD-dependent protein-ADP-ribosyltransferase YbiA (DUF1768 family)
VFVFLFSLFFNVPKSQQRNFPKDKKMSHNKKRKFMEEDDEDLASVIAGAKADNDQKHKSLVAHVRGKTRQDFLNHCDVLRDLKITVVEARPDAIWGINCPATTKIKTIVQDLAKPVGQRKYKGLNKLGQAIEIAVLTIQEHDLLWDQVVTHIAQVRSHGNNKEDEKKKNKEQEEMFRSLQVDGESKTVAFSGGMLSQFYLEPVTAQFSIMPDFATFACNEQAFHYFKGVEFQDKASQDAILHPESNKAFAAKIKTLTESGDVTTKTIEFGKYIKALGRKVKNFNQNRWNAINLDLVVQSTIAKFMANPYMVAALLQQVWNVLPNQPNKKPKLETDSKSSSSSSSSSNTTPMGMRIDCFLKSVIFVVFRLQSMIRKKVKKKKRSKKKSQETKQTRMLLPWTMISSTV